MKEIQLNLNKELFGYEQPLEKVYLSLAKKQRYFYTVDINKAFEKYGAPYKMNKGILIDWNWKKIPIVSV